VQQGKDFGEDPVVELRHPRIAVITDEPTDDRSYGATWFTLGPITENESRSGVPILPNISLDWPGFGTTSAFAAAAGYFWARLIEVAPLTTW